VARDLALPVEEAHRYVARDPRQRPVHKLVRDRVQGAVETDVGRLARRDDPHQVALEGVCGQREQQGPLARVPRRPGATSSRQCRK
jgi:hypothetical protein